MMSIPHFWIYDLLKEGAQGDQVLQLQRSLPAYVKAQGFLYDGKFGPGTKEAVKQFQKVCGLVEDGIVGASTAGALGLWSEVDKGVDISHYQTVVWPEVEGINFVIAKATEGRTYQDPSYKSHAKGAIDKGLDISVYHYTKFLNSPEREALNFLEVTLHQADYIQKYYLDVEESSISDPYEIANWIRRFAKCVKTYRGESSFGIYTSSRVMQELGLSSSGLDACGDLWASDRNSQPAVYPWKSWSVWQTTSEGQVQGISYPVDENLRVLPKSLGK